MAIESGDGLAQGIGTASGIGSRSYDIREAILSRIETVLSSAQIGGAAAFASVKRNDVVDERKFPAAVVLDGDEEVFKAPIMPQAGTSKLMTLKPQVYIRLSREGSTVGYKLSELRSAAVKAILSDTATGGLVDLCGASRGHNGRVEYEGMVTDFAAGRAMQGEAHLLFAFTYPFRPSDL